MPAEESGTSGSSSSSSGASRTPTNTTSLTQSIEKLDGSMATGQSNYNAWRFRIIRILKEKDQLDAIEDSSVSSTKDDQAFTIITLNIKDSQIPYIQNATTAKEAWVALKEVHQGIGMNGKMVLMQRLWALKMSEGQDMSQHLNSFRELANQLRGLSTEGKEVDDSELLTILTLSLPESYEPLVRALQSRTDLITFDMMAGRLLQESARRHDGEVTHKGHEHTQVQGTQTALSANRPSTQYQFRSSRAGFHASSRGRGGFRGGNRGAYGGSGRGFTDNGSRGSSVIRPLPGTKCFYCGKDGHWKKDCYKRKAEDSGNQQRRGSREFTFLAEGPVPAPRQGWIIDSGASQHLCGSKEAFSTYSDISKDQAITIADGTQMKAKGVGSIELVTEASSVKLTSVWHVPGIGGNLLSVSRMVDAGYTVDFGANACHVSKSGVRTLLGKRFGSLYYLNKVPIVHEKGHEAEANLGLSTNQSSSASLETWHRRLCHRTLDEISVRYISSKVQNMEVTGGGGAGSTICGVCSMGRQTKERETKSREKSAEILGVVHSDLCGPMQTSGPNRERYFVTFIDERSGRVSITLLNSKDGVYAAFRSYRARAEKSSERQIKAFRSDSGGEYLSREFRQYLKEAGIQHIISPPYTPSQNGLAERMNRTIMENARCILEDSQLGREFWEYAVLTSAHIHNRLPSRSHNNISPLEHWTGKMPEIGHLRIFGATAWVHIPTEKRQKLDPKSVKCILVGYEEDAGTRVYRLFEPITKKVLLSRDVIIDESSIISETGVLSHTTTDREKEAPTTVLKEREGNEDDFQPLDPIIPLVTPTEDGAGIHDTITVRKQLATQNMKPVDKTHLPQLQELETSTPQRRSQRAQKPSGLFDSQAQFALLAGLDQEPQTLTEALSSEEREQWRTAWLAELTSLAQNQTWVIEPLPEGRRVIGSRWLFKKKEDGRYKARLVAKGYSQQAGIDYEETFAPVAKFTTIRLLLALSCENNWEIEGMDVKTTFLNGELEERIYMEIPEGVAVPANKERGGYNCPLACRLIKSIYGQKQSPRAWYGRIHAFFLENNFTRSDPDHSLFINYDRQIILLLYVDDLVIAAPTQNIISWIRGKLHDEFQMTDLGPLSTFLGLEIQRNRAARTLHLSQSNYVQKILQLHRMELCNPAPTPADPHVHLVKSQPTFEATLYKRRRYQSAVGSLMYAMLGSRPDIAYAVSKVSQYSVNPDPTHWTAVKRIFRYLAGTPNRGLCYGVQGSGIGYTDADWRSAEDRRSIGGYTFILNGAAISWISKKQSTVALSSTEAEYMSLTQGVKESIWLQAILRDFGAARHMEELKNIMVDNQGAIALSRNAEFHARTKHIDIQYHFIREHIERSTIALHYCPTTEMTADIFTKALPQPSFIKHSIGLGLLDHSAFLLQEPAIPSLGDSGLYTESLYEHADAMARSTGEGWCCESPALT